MPVRVADQRRAVQLVIQVVFAVQESDDRLRQDHWPVNQPLAEGLLWIRSPCSLKGLGKSQVIGQEIFGDGRWQGGAGDGKGWGLEIGDR